MSSSNVHRESPYFPRMPPGGWTGEVLPVQDRVREAGRRAAHERVHEGLVLVAAHPGPRQPQVARVVQQLLAVRAHVQADCEDPAWVDAGCHRVDGELADGDVDPADAPVADPEDRLRVGGDDEVDVVGAEAGGLERLVDAVHVLDVEEHPARPTEQVTELLDRRPDGRGVDDRQHLPHVLTDQLVEQHLVGVVQVGQEGPLLDVVVRVLELLVAADDLFLHGLHPGGQHSAQSQVVALSRGERGAAIDLRVVEDIQAASQDVDLGRAVRSLADGEFLRSHASRSSSRAVCEHRSPKLVVLTTGKASPIRDEATSSGLDLRSWLPPPSGTRCRTRLRL